MINIEIEGFTTPSNGDKSLYMKEVAHRCKAVAGAIVLLFSIMVAVVPSFALPRNSSVAEHKVERKKEKQRTSVPEGDMLSMLGLSLAVLSCGFVARRRAVQP